MELVTETGIQVFHRLKRKYFPQLSFQHPLFCPIGVLKVGDLVEITGLSKSGKTQFLYQCIANHILYQLESESHRRELQIVWIDLDWRLDISRIRALLQSSGSNSFSDTQVSQILNQMQICYPQDDWQLLLYLNQLQEQVEESGKSYAIYIDGIGGWHEWNTFTSQTAVQQACFMKLRRLLSHFPVVCIASVKLQMPLSHRVKCLSCTSESSHFIPEYLPDPWKQLVTQKLVTFRLEEGASMDSLDTFIVNVFVKDDEGNSSLKGWKLDKKWKMKVNDQLVTWEACS